MEKVYGLEITYKVKKGFRNIFSKTLFGKVYKQYHSKQYRYIPGILDKLNFVRLGYNKIFIQTSYFDIDMIALYCDELSVKPQTLETDKLQLGKLYNLEKLERLQNVKQEN